jgi:hypothetical protein
MDGNDFNLITPVNSLQSVSSRSDVERRKERKRKERQKRESESQKKNAPGSTDDLGPDTSNDSDSPHRLDFRA